MPAPLRRLVAVCLLLGSMAAPLAALPVASAQPGNGPLRVSITDLSPAAATTGDQKGRFVLQGEVVNSSHDDWTGLTAYLATGSAPLTTLDELSTALTGGQAQPPDTRLTGAGQYVTLPDLAAGATTEFRFSLPISDLGLTAGPGVYRIGVEVFGQGPQGYDEIPDGTAVTFLPLMTKRAAPAAVSIVVPFRAGVARASDGSLLNAAHWAHAVSPDGRLEKALQFSLQASLPINLLVDPAVIDAVESLSQGNPANGDAGSPGADPEASRWLASFSAAVAGSTVLALPYGDVDAGAAVRLDRGDLLKAAQQLSQAQLADYSAVPVLAPMSGYLSPGELMQLSSSDHILLSGASLPNADSATVTARSGTSITLTDQLVGAAPGGDASLTPLRQRLLAELAVRSLTGVGQAPIVFSFPTHWNAPEISKAGAFFQGLDQPWVTGASLPLAGPSDPVVRDGHFSTPEDSGPSVPITNFVAAQGLIEATNTLAELITDPGLVTPGMRQALVAISENVAGNPGPSAARTTKALATVNTQLRKVSISGPTFVTMSSGTGSFQVTITNNLDRNVTVGLDAIVSSANLTVKPVDAIAVEAGQQRSVRVNMTSHHLGVYRVTLHPVTSSGAVLPTTLAVSVRGSQIGQIIWVIIGAAGALLFVTIGMRTVRRLRSRRG